MREGLRRASVLVALVAALLAAVLMIAYVIRGGPAEELSKRTAIVASVLGIVGAVSPVLVWARSKRRRAAPVSTSAQMEAAADLLAVRTSATWSKELVQRGIEAPVRVRWRWAGDDVAVPSEELASSTERSSDPDPLPASLVGGPRRRQILNSGVVTRLHDEVYSRLRHGRLVLIGGPGAGKTGAMMLLLMETLQQRDQLPGPDRAKVPVPVWLTLGSWDPTLQGLREWVTATMARDYPYLRAEDFGPDAIGQLFDTGQIALFLDGLDEMPDAHRTRAVELLTTETPGLRVTLTSRPDQYRATLAAGSQLPDTAVLELRPVGPPAAARYLLDGQVGPARQGWQQVTDRLEADPDGVLAHTLNTPLTLSLARSAYGCRDPAELLSPKLDSPDTLRGHLLDQVLLTAYPDARKRGHAAYWLGWIADQMNSQPAGATRDLHWWEIARWVSTWQRQVLGAILGGLVCAPGIVLLFSLAGPNSELLIAVLLMLATSGALMVGLLIALVVGHSAGVAPSPPQRRPAQFESRRRANKFTGGLLIGLAAGMSSGLTAGLSYLLLTWQGVWYEGETVWNRLIRALFIGLLVGPVAGTVLGFVIGPSERHPRAIVLRLPTGQELRRGLPRIVVGGLPAGLLAAGLLSFVLSSWSTGLSLRVLVVALAFGLTFGSILWLFSDVWSLPIIAATDATPRSVYRKDVQARLFSALLFGFTGVLLGVFIWAILASGDIAGDELPFRTWLADVLKLGLWLGLNVGLVLALVGGFRNGAAPVLFCTQIAFALRGRPVRFVPLLESARNRQVLRQAGAVYQFRHGDLQDRLADRYRRTYTRELSGPPTAPPAG